MIPYPYVLRRRMMIQDIGKLPPMGRGFANYTWAELDAISKAGLAADYFTVGETRSIDLSYTIDEVDYSGTYELAIHGINHYEDELADGSGKAGLTIGFNTVFGNPTNLHSSRYIQSGNLNLYVSYSVCDMRTTYLPRYFSILPADLQAVIKTVNKWDYDVSSGDPERVTLPHTLFLPTEWDVFGYSLIGNSFADRNYEYFKTEANRIKRDTSGTAQAWWTASIGNATDEDWTQAVYIGADGQRGCGRIDQSVIDENAKTLSYRYAAPLFCI